MEQFSSIPISKIDVEIDLPHLKGWATSALMQYCDLS